MSRDDECREHHDHSEQSEQPNDPIPIGASEETFRVRGMDCSEEVGAIERALKPLGGVLCVRANLIASSVTVYHDGSARSATLKLCHRADGCDTIEPASRLPGLMPRRDVGIVHRHRHRPAMAVDVFAKYYTPAVMVLALLVGLVPPLFFNAVWMDWIYRALVLLVIACPCALVISTPVSIVSGLALLGHASLWLAVLADTGATLIVVANALRLLRRRTAREKPQRYSQAWRHGEGRKLAQPGA